MFRKSLQILIATTFLVLAAVVGYALLRFSGPKQSLAEAEALIDKGQLATAIAKLSLAEHAPSLQADPSLLQHLWRLRYDANTRLGNAGAALDDVERLLTHGLADDETLLLDHIRLLAMADQSDRAVQAAKLFLEQHPGHSRGLELAGEACQSAYQPQLIALRSTIDHDVPRLDRDPAREALFRYLYRPAGDRTLADAIGRLAAIYQKEPRLAAAWPPVQTQLQALRRRVQEALDHFQQSLEAGGEPVAAFRGFALALGESERIDDLLFACEIQRRSFHHSYVDEAGAEAAWELQQAGLDEAAISTVDRWLPKGALALRLQEQDLGDGTEDLLLAAAFASFDRGNLDRLRRASGELWQVLKVRSGNGLAATLANALTQHLSGNQKTAEAALLNVVNRTLSQPVAFGRPDPVAVCAPLALEWMAKRDDGEAAGLALLSAWKKARPADITPHLLLADLLFAHGRTGAALNALDDAAAVDPEDERVFLRRVAVLRKHLESSGQDGPGLVAQCLARASLRPEPANPVGYVLCAETALQQNLLPIAAGSAREAVNAMPTARLPRLLEIRAALSMGRYDDAAQMAARLLHILPPDAETALLTVEADQRAGLPTAAAVATAMALTEPSPALQAELLRLAVQQTPRRAHVFVTALATGPQASNLARVLCIEALAQNGEIAAAEARLDAIAADAANVAALTPSEHAALAHAFAAWAVAAAVNRPDDQTLLSATDRRLGKLQLDIGPAAAPLLAAARSLAETHPLLANLLCQRALANADPEDRNGPAFVLAGHLALAAGCRQTAEERWVAALAFEDGRTCAEDLARLCLVDGRIERARQVYAFVTRPTDAALAARCTDLPTAAPIVGAALASEPADLLTQAVLSTFGQPSLLDWTVVPDPQQQERLELLSLMQDPAYADEVLRRARLICTDPAGTADQLVLARCLSMAGHADQAARMHDALLRRGVHDVVFWHEVSLAASRPGYELTPRLRHDLFAPETLAALVLTPNTLAYAMNTMADAFTAGGHPELAANVHLSLWTQAPGQSQLTADDVATIVHTQPAPLAFDLLDKALAGIRPPDPDSTLPLMFEAARSIATGTPDRVPALRRRGLELLQQYGAIGAVVHFVLEHESSPTTAEDDARRRALLRGHLERVATDREDATWLPDTLRRLVGEDGTDATLSLLEATLSNHPTALRLWRERARLATGTPAAGRAVDDLRHVLRHTDAPEQVLQFVAIAAENRLLTTVDIQQLDKLPAALRSSAAGHYAIGLVRLRQGRPDDALPELAAAAPAPNGMHLFARALAFLQSADAQGATRAIELLDTLQRDYPSSSLARYAGSFSRQLAPR